MHGLPGAHHLVEAATRATAALTGIGVALGAISPLLIDGLAGIAAGALALAGIKLGKRLSR